MNARMNELLDTVAAIYARNFTAAELNEIIAFYRGPTGQKFVQRQGGILQESMAAGQKFGQSLGGELQRRMTDELRKKGHDISAGKILAPGITRSYSSCPRLSRASTS
jgi:hypothetical protein